MKKLNLAIIGQGRSGKNIHGAYYRSERNEFYNVKYVVDKDEFRRSVAQKDYPGCITLTDYKELFAFDDIDVIVNASYSEQHYAITLDCLEHGYNVLVEKPMGATEYECQRLLETAKNNNVKLAAFQQSFYAPYYLFAREVSNSGKLGDIVAVDIKFNGFSRRWDWQTLQKKVAGGLFNTGPHPVGLALGFLDFDKETRIEYSKLCVAQTSGDGDDYAKIILSAPGKPVVDVEVSSCDAYSNFNIKVQGSRGCMKMGLGSYELVYYTDEENPRKQVIETSLVDEEGEPCYCSESLIKHNEEGKFNGGPFDIGTASLYKELYAFITEDKPMTFGAEVAMQTVKVISEVHARNPLPVKFL
ncbi:MAG: Gfo/Idh/MocA family oxidoreductase [Ruminococcaceae bacterium]|nr:Gfo/Idh/MocA family oxidoreductase [Oscillospiraceae bacterium]